MAEKGYTAGRARGSTHLNIIILFESPAENATFDGWTERKKHNVLFLWLFYSETRRPDEPRRKRTTRHIIIILSYAIPTSTTAAPRLLSSALQLTGVQVHCRRTRNNIIYR